MLMSFLLNCQSFMTHSDYSVQHPPLAARESFIGSIAATSYLNIGVHKTCANYRSSKAQKLVFGYYVLERTRGG